MKFNLLRGMALFSIIASIFVSCETEDFEDLIKPSDKEAPSAVFGLIATQITTNSVTLSWDASTDNVEVTNYEVYKDGESIGYSDGETTYKVSDLESSTKYQFTVLAKDSAGNFSDEGELLNVTTAAEKDTEAPSAPTALKASNITANSVKLSWTAAEDNVGVNTYDILQDDKVVKTVEGDVTTISIDGLESVTEYKFKVIAKDAADNASEASNIVTVKTNELKDTEAPTAPSNLTASEITATSVKLTWKASEDNVAVFAYDIYQNGTIVKTLEDATATTIVINALESGKEYKFKVVARDAAKNASEASNVVTVQTKVSADTEAPTAPANLAASNITETEVTLTWNASEDNVAVTAYDIYQNGTLVKTVTADKNTVVISGLESGTKYNFKVVAKDEAGNNSDASNVVSPTTKAGEDKEVPTAPANLTASNITESAVTLTWKASEDNVGVTAYDIYQNGAVVKTVTGDKVTVTITGLDADTKYNFKVVAKDAADNASEASNIVSATTKAGEDKEAPTAPANLAASNITESAVTLTWKASEDNVGVTAYDVYQNGAVVKTVTGDKVTVTITELEGATKYTFKVVAKDAAGNASEASNIVSPTTKAVEDTEAPSKVTGLQAVTITENSITIKWTAATDNIGIASYDVLVNGAVKGNVTEGTAFTLDGLNGGTVYQITVRAKDAAGNQGAVSDVLEVTTKEAADTEAPTAVSGLKASNIKESSLTLNWNAATDNKAVTGYEIHQNGSKVGTTTGNTYFNVTGLTAGTNYNFVVYAFDEAGNMSSQSNQVTVTTLTEAPTKKLSELIEERPELSKLEEFLTTLEVDRTLEEDGPYTVFAPNNAAFDSYGPLPEGSELTYLIIDHVAGGAFTAEQLVEKGTIQAGVDNQITITKNANGEYIINGSAKIVTKDIQATNGVLHIIDKIIPFN
ncbi:fibronectin type III domain-containing protein [Robertkochia solimangrovi]|uniref:fibronectin type III domain-containing protein n=1 Tax=Robertkochia solimangrovi TaxID=2213046 RepID=UPI0011804B8E|nr:fibronectin type III domain-containing protein [Robertkochia solimangrovi]TRZ46118.1 hypothetical protein DMZ48_02325 [Robertkochia solimangrovi]